ncbi:MAG: type VI secretion system baseplate subunit TssF [Holosporales bacterium]|nr:type VI secretion system baseplate subunit TssF [Holosporales bacterium]
MNDILNYYKDELLLLRQKGREFAKKYPEIASAIDIKDGESTDPHTERIIESVAFMAARLHQKIEINSEHIAFYILNAIAPNLAAPFPPCSVVSFYSNVGEPPNNLINIPSRTSISHSTKTGGVSLFRTIYPLDIYPLLITNVSIERNSLYSIEQTNGWYIKIDLETNSVPIEGMNCEKILFHINSNIIEDALIVYEAIFANCDTSGVYLKIGDSIIETGEILPCGFCDNEMACPIKKYSSNIFQLFGEMLNFKQKFMFFEIHGINESIKRSGITDISEISLIIKTSKPKDRLFQIINKNTFLLNCTPIVNLFPFTADPFRLTNEKNKYLLLPDQTRNKELLIHSINSVHYIDSNTYEDKIIQPYFSLAIDSDTNVSHNLFWIYSKNDENSSISFVDTELIADKVYDNIIYTKLMCMNKFASRDIPVLARMDIENLETGGVYATLLYKNTNPKEVPNNLWALVSELASTYISISHGDSLLSSVRKIMDLFSTGAKIKSEELISGISKINSSKVVKRFGSDAWRGFVQGMEYNILCRNEENSYMSFFLGCFINQYLSSCISINSFVQLNLVSEKTNEKMASWEDTSGRKELV